MSVRSAAWALTGLGTGVVAGALIAVAWATILFGGRTGQL